MPHKQVQRAKIILLSAKGLPSSEIVHRIGVSYPRLTCWRERFAPTGIGGAAPGQSARLAGED